MRYQFHLVSYIFHFSFVNNNVLKIKIMDYQLIKKNIISMIFKKIVIKI